MSFDSPLSRKQVLASFAAGIATLAIPSRTPGQTGAPAAKPETPPQTPANPAAASAEITVEDLKVAEKLAGLTFTDEERKEILDDVKAYRAGYDALRKTPIKETTSPPLAYVVASQTTRSENRVRADAAKVRDLKRPSREDDVAFMSIGELGQLLRSKQISSLELTRIYLNRLKSYGDALLCVVTLTENLAIQQAEDADADLAKGLDRGPLHGIPYGIKDLFATQGAPTTWGAEPFKDQVFNYDAAVVERLRAAGAVMVAKTSMGALAMGDVWFRGTTKNPWNLKQGSSGSSAGSASAVAAGLVAFGIGTETSGSILSPSLRCRVTGLRPTFGRVSRYGAMELSYSLDRVGPLCRRAEDCALVLSVLAGADPRDPSSVDRDFQYPQRVDMRRLRFGWVGGENSLEGDPAVAALRKLGATVVATKVAPFPEGIYPILPVEAASAFDAFTRGEAIQLLKNSSWPQTFRGGRVVPAVEYLQAQRARTLMTKQLDRDFEGFDFLLGPGVGGAAFSPANFSGYPAIQIPFGDDGQGNSVGKTIIGRPYDEARMVSVAKVLQDQFDFYLRRPNLSA